MISLFMEIDPVALHIGPLNVYWYGIIMAVAVACGYFVALREARRTGFSEDCLLDLVIIGVIVGWLGARIYYVSFNWDYYSQHLSEIYKIWHGGLAVHGGIIASILLGLIYCHRKKLDFWQTTDLFAPAFILGQAIGRWGNFVNQEAYGFETDLPWAMYIDGAYRHPTFLYESLWDLAVFIFLLWLRRRKNIKTGDICLSYIGLYSVGRFVVEYFRTDSLMLGPLKAAQAVSVCLILIAVIALLIRHKAGFAHPLTVGAVKGGPPLAGQDLSGSKAAGKTVNAHGKTVQSGKSVSSARKKDKQKQREKERNKAGKKH